LRLLGQRSYAMYLIHYCVIQAVEQKLGVGMFTACLVAAPPVCGYAWAMWRFVEAPLAGIRKGFRSRRIVGSNEVLEGIAVSGNKQIKIASAANRG
jgi:peptidoglycan/LPS O-acetylase OafA/YrhL